MFDHHGYAGIQKSQDKDDFVYGVLHYLDVALIKEMGMTRDKENFEFTKNLTCIEDKGDGIIENVYG